MRNVLNTSLFGAALLVAAAGFAQSSTSPQKGDEDRTPQTSATSPSGTDTNSTGSTTGSSTDANATGTTGTTGTYGSTGTAYGTTGSSKMTPRTYTGTVKTINAGRTLVITMANGRMQTFDISNAGTLDPAVVSGSRVLVKQTVDASGKTVVTVEPYR